MCKTERTDSCSSSKLKIDGVDAAPDVIGADQIRSGFAAPPKRGSELLPLDAVEVITCGLEWDRLPSVDVVGQDLLGRVLDLVELLQIFDT